MPLMWGIFGLSVFVAGVLTYHDATKGQADTSDREDAQSAIDIGRRMADPLSEVITLSDEQVKDFYDRFERDVINRIQALGFRRAAVKLAHALWAREPAAGFFPKTLWLKNLLGALAEAREDLWRASP